MKRRNGISNRCFTKEPPNYLEETFSSRIKRREKYINPYHVMADMLTQLFRERDAIMAMNQPK